MRSRTEWIDDKPSFYGGPDCRLSEFRVFSDGVTRAAGELRIGQHRARSPLDVSQHDSDPVQPCEAASVAFDGAVRWPKVARYVRTRELANTSGHERCCTCSRRFLAHFTNSLRCGDHVWLQRHLPRRGQASGMRARPKADTRRWPFARKF